jgi:hypothetical protein
MEREANGEREEGGMEKEGRVGELIPSLEPRGGGWHPGASQRGAVSSSLGLSRAGESRT